jgi:two-component sensor histidine kinase
LEAVAQRPDGTLVPFIPFPTPLTDETGKLLGAVNMLVDITERKRAEDQQALLIRELHHRVQNMLATVQAIMGSTARASTTIQEFQEAFTGRIVSLSKTHTVLAANASQKLSLRELLCNELDPYDDDTGKRVVLAGPEVYLESSVAIPLGMAIHELTTNAVKYGALSVMGGSVEVKWSMLEEGGPVPAFRVAWVERNGPKVEPPTHRGFGSQLLQRVLTHQIGAEANLDYLEDGLRAHIRVPLPSMPVHPLDTLQS